MANDSGDAPTHRPREDVEYEWLGFSFGLHFHPPIKLTAKDAHEFSAAVTERFEIDYANIESDGWTLSSSRHGFRVTVTQSQLELHCEPPEERQERYEVYYQRIVNCFEERFHPQVVLASKAAIRGLLDMDGDSRLFLTQQVLKMSSERLDLLQRPVHGLGLRLFFPSFRTKDEVDGERSCDWDLDVRLESWLPDPRKLFVEADATWGQPEPWNEKCLEAVFGRLGTVSEYVKKEIRGFLMYNRNHDTEE